MGKVPMDGTSRWKAVAALALTFALLLAAVPNVLPKATFDHLPAWAQRKINLSYDLQGGSRTVVVVNRQALLKEKLEQLRDDVRRTLRDRRIRLQGIPVIRDGTVEVRLRPEDFEQGLARLRELAGPPALVATRPPATPPKLPPGTRIITADRSVPRPPADYTVESLAPDATVSTREGGLIILKPTAALLAGRLRQANWQTMHHLEHR